MRRFERGEVYPRVGGGAEEKGDGASGDAGLSPRGRGSPRLRLRMRSRVGSIPAWAGEPSRSPGSRRRCTVYPRVGGGARAVGDRGGVVKGLSPRGRGSRRPAIVTQLGRRSIPAWAGEPACSASFVALYSVYPRVGGGTHFVGLGTPLRRGLSPRGRGSRGPRGADGRGIWSIPAWAGELPIRAAGPEHPAVYPRVGGGA